MNTATIIITETEGIIRAEVQYDPLPVIGGVVSEPAKIANWMISELRKHVPKDEVLSNCIYDARTGETFTEDKVSKQATDYQSTI